MKKRSTKKLSANTKRNIIVIITALVVLSSAAIGGYFANVRAMSKQYNLIALAPKNLPAKQDAEEEGFVQLGDVNMHYVRYGNGPQPVILIHGNGGNADSLQELAQYLANDYTVYCIASRCQGKSSDPGVITYDLMAKDVWEFIHAKLSVKPYVLGHSDGGIVALSLASLYPDSIAACISCGANSHPKKFKFYFTAAVWIGNLFHKDKLNDLMLQRPDFTPEYLARITAPTDIVAGEYDIMPLSDTVYLHQQIQNSRIAIAKGENHSSYVSQNGGKIYQLAKAFFAEQPQGAALD